jgi:hypothetical protein
MVLSACTYFQGNTVYSLKLIFLNLTAKCKNKQTGKYIEKFPNYKGKAVYMFKKTRKVGKLKHIGLFS